MAAAVVAAVLALGVGDEEALHDPADRCLAGPDQQVDMDGPQAVAVQLERFLGLQVGECFDKGGIIVVAA